MVLLDIYKNKRRGEMRRYLWLLDVTLLIWNPELTHTISWRTVFVEGFLEPMSLGNPLGGVIGGLRDFWSWAPKAYLLLTRYLEDLGNGCFNWMMQNFYMENGEKWLKHRKHPAFNGCSTATSQKSNSFIKPNLLGQIETMFSEVIPKSIQYLSLDLLN